MRLDIGLLGLAGLFESCNALPEVSQTQLGAATTPQQRAQAVKDEFSFAWDGYHKHAFPNDELLPVSNGYSNTRSVRTRTCALTRS